MQKSPVLVVLSARNTGERLKGVSREAAWNLLRDQDWKEGKKDSMNLADIAYTLQVGREAMDSRVGLSG